MSVGRLAIASGSTGGDGPRAHEHQLVAGVVCRRELTAELEDGAVVELSALARDRGRPDLTTP